jgi:hypothetical protein
MDFFLLTERGTSMRKILRSMIAVLFLSTMTIPTVSNTANAAETEKKDQGTFELENVNGSVLEIKLHDAEFYFDEDGNAMIKDTVNGAKEALPKTGTDKDDNPVNLEYKKTEDGFLAGAITDNQNSIQTMSVGKCVTGVSGGAITGAGTLGLGGAAAGTVTIPGIGTVGGGLVGGIAGAVGGGLTGAATFCF